MTPEEGEWHVARGEWLLAQTESQSFFTRWRAHARMVGWWSGFKMAWSHRPRDQGRIKS